MKELIKKALLASFVYDYNINYEHPFAKEDNQEIDLPPSRDQVSAVCDPNTFILKLKKYAAKVSSYETGLIGGKVYYKRDDIENDLKTYIGEKL